MVLPVAWLFGLSFLADDGSLSLAHYRRMIEQPSYARIFLATFKVSFITTAVCVVLGYPLAYVLAQLPRRVANLLPHRGACCRSGRRCSCAPTRGWCCCSGRG